MRNPKNWFVFALATLAFLGPMKFCVPTMIQSSLPPPLAPVEWIYFLWPNEILVILAFATLIWLVLDRQRMLARVDVLFVLPLALLLSQALAVPGTICVQTTLDTLMLIAAGVLVFYAAAWYVRDGAAAMRIFGGIALATLFVCLLAMQQHFGGLQETREFAAGHVDRAHTPADFFLRMTSDRVFGSFAYPNALAGFIVLAFTPTLAWIWVRARGWDARVKWLALVFATAVMIATLIWTGSRGGVVAFAAMGLSVLWCLTPKRGRLLATIVLAVLIAAVGIFVLSRRGGLSSGAASSAEARTDYWRGAVAIIKDHPWVGTGPGTFGSIYPKYKTATTEEAQAAHNTYLQMWSDSGVTAFLVFGILWIVGIWDGFRLVRHRMGDLGAVAACGSLMGWAVHGLMDFDFYVPGLALPAFLLLGTIQGLKDLPKTDSVPSQRRRVNWLVGAVCGAVLLSVLWTESRSLAAIIIRGRMDRETSVGAALNDIRRATQLAPWNANFQATFGDVYLHVRDYPEAIAAYRRAVNRDPCRASRWWHLALALEKANGVDNEVVRVLTTTVELNPTNPQYRQALTAAEESVRQAPRSLLQSAPAKDRGFSDE